MTVVELLGIALLAAGGGGIAYFALSRARQGQAEAKRHGAIAEADRLLEQSRREADSVRREAEIQAKDIVLQARAESDRQARQHERDLAAIEKRASQRDEALARKLDVLTEREAEWTRKMQTLDAREKGIEGREREAQSLLESVRSKLEEVAGLTRDEAKRTLMDQMLDEARHDAAKQIRQVESEAREESDRRAKKIISIAIERMAGEFVAERTVSVVSLPNDDMKGRIIGREGRNIRAIEAATGVDLIIDDTPEVVVISCHNPIRRELARLALERLMSDGRIHPGRIEEVVRKAEQELDSTRGNGRSSNWGCMASTLS
jgi:ribonuclease Y